MEIFRVLARWEGFTGSPGYSNFHFAGGGGLISDAQQVADRVSTAFNAVDQWFPDGLTVKVQPEVEVLDSATGELQGYQNITPGPTAEGTSPNAYSAPSGAVINWRTNDVRFGRRIRGRTFLVPLISAAYDDNGSLSSGAIASLNDFGAALTGFDFDSEFGVWSRPIAGTGGVFASVTGFTVPDKAAVLRSRRD